MKGSGVCVCWGVPPLPLPDKHERPSWLDSPALLFAQRKTPRVKVIPSMCGAGSRLRPWSSAHSRAVTSKGIPGPGHLGQTSLLVSGHTEVPAF